MEDLVRDGVLRALEQELKRSLEGLSVPGSPRPHFVQATLRRGHELRLRAAYGSLQRSRLDDTTRLFVDVRVGSPVFDNVIDGGLDARADERESAEWVEAPQDLDPLALQVALWKLLQVKFDEAVRDYYEHRKAEVSEYLRDARDSFSQERATVHVEPLAGVEFPRAGWEQALRSVSRRFLEHPEVHDPAIALRAERLQRFIVTSEGTRVATEEIWIEVDIVGWALSEDGVYTEASRQLFARDLAQAPDEAAIAAACDEVLAELRELATAESPGAYVGPALLGGQAAATLLHEALGHRLEGERSVARGETRTFARLVAQDVLPAGFGVVDDPGRRGPDGQPVWGGYRIDDQGVPGQRAELVTDGKLVGFLQSRTPTAVSARSNGHARHDGLQLPMARMAHLVLTGPPESARSRAELEAMLRERGRAAGRSWVVILERIAAGETSTSNYDFQAFKGEPAEVWRVDVATGERRRLRDVQLVGTPLSALHRIVAHGAAGQGDAGTCVAESGAVPVSGDAPDLLLAELELQQASTSGFHEPLLPPPFADDGSRGRALANPRARGRRAR